IMLWAGLNVRRESKAMAATQTSAVKDLKGLAAGALVELKGVLRSSSPIEAEFSKERCLFHCSRIEEEHESKSSSSSSSDTTTKEVHRNVRWSPVWLEDATGQCRIMPEGATTEGSEILDRRETAGLGGLSLSFGGFSLGTTLKAKRFREDIIRPDQAIYVLGTLLEDGSIGADPAKKGPLIISTKSEEQRTKSNRSSLFWLLILGLVAFIVAGVTAYHAWIK
ncbi:MAG: hypothetical protein F9K44_14025, partial [Hyphomicrobiaceae bacterium]